MHYYWNGYANPGWYGLVGFIMYLLIFGVIILAIVGMARYFTHGMHIPAGGSGKSAMDHLKERYAKGEITKHEFDSMKKDIEG